MRWSFDFTAILARRPGIARGGAISSSPFLDLGHLELEELHQELGGDTRQDQLRPARLAVDLGDVGAHTVAHPQFLLAISWSRGSSASTRPDSTIRLPRSARFTVPVTRDSPRSRKSLRICSRSGVADLLQDHLLGGLRADAPEGLRFERLLDHVAQSGFRVLGHRVGDRDLVRRLLVLLVGHHRPAAERVVLARLAVDLHAHVDLVLEALLGRRRRAPSRAPGTRCPWRRFSRAPARRPAKEDPDS
jgi:hypothetical protein